jgi:hypothetical protein
MREVNIQSCFQSIQLGRLSHISAIGQNIRNSTKPKSVELGVNFWDS